MSKQVKISSIRINWGGGSNLGQLGQRHLVLLYKTPYFYLLCDGRPNLELVLFSVDDSTR